RLLRGRGHHRRAGRPARQGRDHSGDRRAAHRGPRHAHHLRASEGHGRCAGGVDGNAEGDARMIGTNTAVAIYLVCWVNVLFTVLPLGMNQGPQERQQDGGDWGAPANPNLKKKFITTTWVSALVWLAIMAIIFTGVLPLPDLPGAG